MNFRAFVKSEFGNLKIEDVLNSPPSVLLGVDSTMATTLASMHVQTVFDLAASTLFGNAARVLTNSTDIGSIYRKFGRAPAAIVDAAQVLGLDVATLPLEGIQTLIGLDAAGAQTLEQQLSIKTIRDLALWPPYLAAKAIAVEAYNPALPDGLDPSAPRELIPVSGEFGTERHLYSSVVMFPGSYDKSIPLNKTLFDVSATPLYGFDRMRFGARITYAQIWFPRYVAKGQLLHSLPLAPGESTNVVIIDWTNKAKAATRQSISESEKLYSTNDRTRTISQIATSVASDFESGSSETLAQSASAGGGGIAFLGIGIGNASASGNETTSSSHTVSTGSRAIATTLQQNIVDSTQQNSSSIRSQRAAVVSEVSQSDAQNFSTRNVTNYNHMHALTLQYYEVVQMYEAQVRQEDVERCIFIPMELFDFRDGRTIFKYLQILKRVALDYDTRAMLRQLEDKTYGYTLHWGFSRVANNFLTQPAVQQFIAPIIQGYRTLDNRGFLKLSSANPVEILKGDLSLNYELQLNDIVVLNSRSQSPRSLVSGVELDLEDGTTLSFTTPAQGAAGDPSHVNAAFGGKSVPFGKIRAIRLKTTNYAFGQNNFAARLTRVMLALKLNGESRFFDASFVIEGAAGSYANRNLLSVEVPEELVLLEQELMQHQLYYSQQIWLQDNPQNIVMQFAPLTLTLDGQTINLVDYLVPRPVTVVGNYLVYKFTYEHDKTWQDWLKQNFDQSKVLSDMVAVPTGGVFAEAVLGRFNAAEKLDITRFANWHDSPPPIKPPEINPVKFAEPALPTVPGQATFSAPLVNIQAPMALPSAGGLSDVLASLVKGSSFPDVSGLTQTGDAGTKATDLASAESIAAAKANGDAFAQLLTSLGSVLQTAVSKDASKTLSDAGALLNKKDAEPKKAAPNKPSTNGTGTDGTGAGKATEADVLDAAISGSTLASLGGGDIQTATDATVDGITAISSDQALLQSKLITDPLFEDVTGFLVLLQLIPDENLLDVVEKRFGNLDKSVDAKTKFTQVMNAFTTNSAQLTEADRILFALRFEKQSVLPDNATLDQAQIKKLKDLAVDKMVTRAMTVAGRVNPGSQDVLRQILKVANDQLLYDINQIAYVLATAYHESAMGRFMTELANGISTDTVFTKDEYFFNAIAGKKNSYNGINGNKLAGDQLQAAGTINAAADVTAWNGNVYPNAQPTAVKLAARTCDFYRFVGRGLVQITGRDNYHKFSNAAQFGNVDLEANPDRAADVDIAAQILVGGMLAGDFRGGHKLGDYAAAAGFDGVNARDIVNGDKATNGVRIKDIAVEFQTSLIINSKLDESTQYL